MVSVLSFVYYKATDGRLESVLFLWSLYTFFIQSIVDTIGTDPSDLIIQVSSLI